MKKSIFKCLTGSRAYGTNIETSDYDYKGVFVQDNDDILTFKYQEQYQVGKDETHYEVRRFLQLAQSANPTILEMLFTPKEFWIHSYPQWELIYSKRHRFLTTKCADSFGGYAVAQIKKAKGLDKKMNWEKSRVERKWPLDFCYIYDAGKSVPLTEYFRWRGMHQQFCGLTALDHMRDCYNLYYNWSVGDLTPDRNTKDDHFFRGIVHENSNEVLLSSIPKHVQPVGIIYYNKDGYSMHCKDYREYTEWLEKRNTQRFVDTGHGQQIDGKNLMHCRRLLDMAMEIVNTGDLNIVRPNAEYLLKIRRGEVPLQEIIDEAEEDIEALDGMYDNCLLPDNVNMEFLNDLLLQVRKL